MKSIDTRGNLIKTISNTQKINEEKLEKICQNNKSEKTCRYIMCVKNVGYFCAKHTMFKTMLDERVGNSQMVSKGDNCKGLK